MFNISIPSTFHGVMKGDEVTTPTASLGIINTSQSTITFAGAPVLVTLVWKVVGLVFPTILGTMVFPVVLSLIVGMLIYWQSETTGGNMKQKILGFIFALLNSFAIAATVLGINTAAGGTVPRGL